MLLHYSPIKRNGDILKNILRWQNAWILYMSLPKYVNDGWSDEKSLEK